ncbi:MAG: hypothetical protein AAF518_20515 [Spirochaetota bacterium]
MKTDKFTIIVFLILSFAFALNIDLVAHSSKNSSVFTDIQSYYRWRKESTHEPQHVQKLYKSNNTLEHLCEYGIAPVKIPKNHSVRIYRNPEGFDISNAKGETVLKYYHYPMTHLNSYTSGIPKLGTIRRTSIFSDYHSPGSKQTLVEYLFFTKRTEYASHLLWDNWIILHRRYFKELKRFGCQHLDDEYYQSIHFLPNFNKGFIITMKPKYESWFLKNFHILMNPVTLMHRKHFFSKTPEIVPYWRCILPLSQRKSQVCLEQLEKEKYPGGSILQFIRSDYFQNKYNLLDYNGVPLKEKELIWLLSETNYYRTEPQVWYIHRAKDRVIPLIPKGTVLYIPFPLNK